MDNVVMATLAGLPMADGAAAAPSGAGKADGGQFGAMMLAEIAQLAGAGKDGKKPAAGQANDSLAAMLLAWLIQGLTQNDAEDEAAVNEEAGAAAVQGQAATADISTLADITKLIEIFAAGNSENGMFMRLLTGGKDAREALSVLLSGNDEDGALTNFMDTLPADERQSFASLIEALQGGPDESASANQDGLKALTEIRKLFSELVSTGTVSPDEATQAQGLGEAAPARLTKALINDILSRIDAQAAEAETQPAAAPVVTLTIDTGDDAGAEEPGAEVLTADDGVATDKAQKASGGSGEPVDFAAALRAYRGEAVNTTASPAENSAAMALRQGERAFDAIVDKITSMQGAGQKELEIRLKPDFLGNVVIKLTMGDEGLTATIAASNPKVQDAFLSQAASLQSTLAEQGLKDVRIVVTSSSVQDAALQQQQLSQGHREARQEKQKHGTAAITAAGITSAAAPQPLLVYEQAYRTGLVNRLA